jgi:hypothetical protein
MFAASGTPLNTLGPGSAAGPGAQRDVVSNATASDARTKFIGSPFVVAGSLAFATIEEGYAAS